MPWSLREPQFYCRFSVIFPWVQSDTSEYVWNVWHKIGCCGGDFVMSFHRQRVRSYWESWWRRLCLEYVGFFTCKWFFFICRYMACVETSMIIVKMICPCPMVHSSVPHSLEIAGKWRKTVMKGKCNFFSYLPSPFGKQSPFSIVLTVCYFLTYK